MRPVISFVAILASHALAKEFVNSQLDGLDRRQTSEYCGVDVAGDDLWCINSSCCASSLTGVWSCTGPEDQCCATGYTCPSGSQCYLDSSYNQWCLEGSNTVTAGTGAAPQTSASNTALPTPPPSIPGTSTTTTAPHTLPTKSNGAGGVTADALAKIVQLAGAAALLL